RLALGQPDAKINGNDGAPRRRTVAEAQPQAVLLEGNARVADAFGQQAVEAHADKVFREEAVDFFRAEAITPIAVFSAAYPNRIHQIVSALHKQARNLNALRPGGHLRAPIKGR